MVGPTWGFGPQRLWSQSVRGDLARELHYRTAVERPDTSWMRNRNPTSPEWYEERRDRHQHDEPPRHPFFRANSGPPPESRAEGSSRGHGRARSTPGREGLGRATFERWDAELEEETRAPEPALTLTQWLEAKLPSVRLNREKAFFLAFGPDVAWAHGLTEEREEELYGKPNHLLSEEEFEKRKTQTPDVEELIMMGEAAFGRLYDKATAMLDAEGAKDADDNVREITLINKDGELKAKPHEAIWARYLRDEWVPRIVSLREEWEKHHRTSGIDSNWFRGFAAAGLENKQRRAAERFYTGTPKEQPPDSREASPENGRHAPATEYPADYDPEAAQSPYDDADGEPSAERLRTFNKGKGKGGGGGGGGGDDGERDRNDGRRREERNKKDRSKKKFRPLGGGGPPDSDPSDSDDSGGGGGWRGDTPEDRRAARLARDRHLTPEQQALISGVLDFIPEVSARWFSTMRTRAETDSLEKLTLRLPNDLAWPPKIKWIAPTETNLWPRLEALFNWMIELQEYCENVYGSLGAYLVTEAFTQASEFHMRDVHLDREMRERTKHYAWTQGILPASSLKETTKTLEFLNRLHRMMVSHMPEAVKTEFNRFSRYAMHFGPYKKFQLLGLAYNKAMGIQSPKDARFLRTVIKRPDGRSIQNFEEWVRLVDWSAEMSYIDNETWRVTAANLWRLYRWWDGDRMVWQFEDRTVNTEIMRALRFNEEYGTEMKARELIQVFLQIMRSPTCRLPESNNPSRRDAQLRNSDSIKPLANYGNDDSAVIISPANEDTQEIANAFFLCGPQWYEDCVDLKQDSVYLSMMSDLDDNAEFPHLRACLARHSSNIVHQTFERANAAVVQVLGTDAATAAIASVHADAGALPLVQAFAAKGKGRKGKGKGKGKFGKGKGHVADDEFYAQFAGMTGSQATEKIGTAEWNEYEDIEKVLNDHGLHAFALAARQKGKKGKGKGRKGGAGKGYQNRGACAHDCLKCFFVDHCTCPDQYGCSWAWDEPTEEYYVYDDEGKNTIDQIPGALIARSNAAATEIDLLDPRWTFAGYFSSSQIVGGWKCIKCAGTNYPDRPICFTKGCGEPRPKDFKLPPWVLAKGVGKGDGGKGGGGKPDKPPRKPGAALAEGEEAPAPEDDPDATTAAKARGKGGKSGKKGDRGKRGRAGKAAAALAGLGAQEEKADPQDFGSAPSADKGVTPQ